MRTKKGFIFSVIAISFMLLLMFLAVTMANEYWETERVVAKPQPISYSTSTLDNIGKQFCDIILPSAEINENNESLRIAISDSNPRPGITSDLNSMKTYVENNLADSIHASISANISEVNNGSIEATLANNFVYRNEDSTVSFHPKINNTSTGATNYWINISVNEIRNTVNDFSFGGSGMNITLRYTDQNGTVETSGEVNPNAQNKFWITYGENETKRIDITLGNIAPGNNTWDGSLKIDNTNASIDFSFDAELPLQNSTTQNKIVLPLPMNYTQGSIHKTMNASR
jgi:hypothetical protein